MTACASRPSLYKMKILEDPDFSRPVYYVDSSEGLKQVLPSLQTAPLLGVDTESNSLYVFREQVCLIQISNASTDYIFDPILISDLAPLGGVFTDPKIKKIFHGGDFDIGLLKREFNFRFSNLFDTMIAAQFLGYEHFSLAALVEKICGIRLDKKFTKSDWGTRPLSREQIIYLVKDSEFLIQLFQKLSRELKERDLEEEGGIEFEHLSHLPALPHAYSQSTWGDMKGVKDLEPGRRGVLAELFQWRQERAREKNRPPFKILNPSTLLELARLCPRDEEALRPIRGISPRVRQRYGDELLAAIRRGRALSAPLPLPPPRRRGVAYRDSALTEALKGWRREKAPLRRVHPLAVLPGRVLKEIVRLRPSRREELVRIEGWGEKRTRLYGDDIIRLVAAAR